MYSYNQCNVKSVELYRDGIDCPWGFRLKGGIDVDGGTPLEIIRVSIIFADTEYFFLICVWSLVFLFSN